MRVIFSFLLFLQAIVCYAKVPVELTVIKSVFEKFDVNGSILIYDQENNEYMGYNLSRCNEGFLPASTFKIPNTLIALETGVVTPEMVFTWNEEKRRMSVWEKDMDIREAFKVSAVPVYQEIARRIGVERMQAYLRLFNYGEMDVQADTIDNFWLEGQSNITSYQQIYFLKQLFHLQLPVSESAMLLTKDIMRYADGNGYVLSGKTGWGTYKGKEVTWFVGYVETTDNVYFFVTNLEPTSTTDMSQLGNNRIELTQEVFRNLKVLE